ncbi:reverse transcriptase domain-containing protein [Tanacetum coccineum]|uniref:Reverse transcriptase domain-containing protein n=1 Tax=Tanacetum coccineum TaxID=301880 RepID=A0ABQ5EQH4_9ASTR
MLKSLLSNKEKLLELANTPLNENCSAVILKKLPEKLGDPEKFLIPCSFSELKCKDLADLGASINLMPLSVWKKLGLPELIPTQITLELANHEICTPVGIARDVFVPVRKFTFHADFVIVDYESDPRVPLILGRPFLRTARALIDVHGEEMILRDGNERLTLNIRHDTSSYSTQPHQESINMIDVYNVSHEEILEDLFATNHLSGNPTSSLTSHTNLTSLEVNDDIFDPEGNIIENLLNLDKTKDLPSYHDNPLSGNPTSISEPVTKSSSSSPTLSAIEESDLIWEEFEAYLASDPFPLGNSNPLSPLPPFHNSLSGSTTSSSPSLSISETSDYSLEEFADELAHFASPPGIDYLPFNAESDLREIEYLLNPDPIKEMDSILKDSVDSPDDNLVDTISEMFTDYLYPPLWDDYDDELFDLETVNDDTYDDPFYSKEEKIKDSKILIDELDPPGSSDFLPSPDCDLVFYEDFFRVINRATPDKNVKKLSSSNASLILEDFNPPLYELPFHKEVTGSETLLSFSSENEEKVLNLRILTSKGFHTSLLLELSHRGPEAFKETDIRQKDEKSSQNEQNQARNGKKFDEDLGLLLCENGIFKDFQDTSESSNDNTNVVNALREPFVVNQDPGEKSSQGPPQIDHNCCYKCGDSLDGIFCRQCICKSCGKGAHFGYNCPPKDPIISKPEPCNQTIKLPQTLPSLDPSCFSLPHVSKPNLVDDPPNVFNLYPQILPIVQPICNYENGNSFTYDSKPHSFNVSSSVFNQPQQPQFETYLCELCGNNAHYGYDCSPQFPFQLVDREIKEIINDLAYKRFQGEEIDEEYKRDCEIRIRKLKQDFNKWGSEVRKKEKAYEEEKYSAACRYMLSVTCDDEDDYIPLAITTDLPIEEPDNSLKMGDEHLDTIPARESDEVIKSSVENLVPISSEFEGISNDTCDVPNCDNNYVNVESELVGSLINHDTSIVHSSKIDPILEEFAGELAHIAPIPSGIVEADFDSNNDTSSDDDNLRRRVRLARISDVEQEEKEFDLEDILQIQDIILHEKLLNIHRLISKIESLKVNSTPERVLKSPYLFPIPIMDSDLSDTSLSHLDISLPEFETFSNQYGRDENFSTTTHANYSLPECGEILGMVNSGGVLSLAGNKDIKGTGEMF